jgi:putative PIN family toxin of toxin-antitoxin system
LLLAIRERQHTLVVSTYLLAELARVLTYPRLMARHGLSPEGVREFLAAVETVGEMVATPLDSVEAIVSADPEDDPIVQLAVCGKAEVLCTVDRDIHNDDVKAYCAKHRIRVMTDVELLRLFRELESPKPGT